jgi:hypothetical protein
MPSVQGSPPAPWLAKTVRGTASDAWVSDRICGYKRPEASDFPLHVYVTQHCCLGFGFLYTCFLLGVCIIIKHFLWDAEWH